MEREKKIFYQEIAYILGVCLIAFSTAVAEAANFGVSMVVAPSYLFHLKISETLPFVTFGVAEYCFQGILLILLVIIMRKFKLTYIFAFVTAVFYGLVLDGFIWILSFVPKEILAIRIIFYVLSILVCSFGVALLFHTYISPEVYELFVKEVSSKYGFTMHKFKTFYDCTSCVIAIIMSFIFFGFGHFEGVKWGTVICALLNGFLIGRFGSFMEKRFDFKVKLPKFQKLFK